MIRFRLALFLLAAFQKIVAQPESLPMRRISFDGRELVGVHAIHHDLQGNIWIGMANAPLAKFDGESFREYGAREFSTSQFKGKTSSYLVFEDRKANLWAGLANGSLWKYDRTRDKFRLMNDSLTGSNGFLLYAALENKDGSFWLASMGGGLIWYHPETKKYKRYESKKGDISSLPDNFVNSLVRDPSGELWVGTTGGLCRYLPSTDNFERFSLSNRSGDDMYRYRVIRNMILSSKGLLFVATYGGLHIVDPKNRSSRHVLAFDHPDSLSHNSLFKMAEDTDGFIWMATQGGGINRYNPISNTFAHWQTDPSDNSSIPSNNLFVVYIDRQGFLWTGFNEATISVHSLKRKKFNKWVHRFNRPGSIPQGLVLSFYQESDSIYWLGFHGEGLARVNAKKETAITFRHDPKNVNSLGHNKVRAIQPDRFDPNILWLVLEGGGVNKLDTRTKRFTRYEVNKSSNRIINNAVAGLLVDKTGKVWTTTFRSGISIFDPVKNYFKRIKSDSLQAATGVLIESVEKIFEHDGNIWLSGRNQLSVYDTYLNRFIPIVDADQLTAFVNSSFFDLHPYNQKQLVLFTDTLVQLMEYVSGQAPRFQTILRHPPGEGSFLDVLLDRGNNIWYVTANQLVCQNIKSGRRQVYNEHDGLIDANYHKLQLDKNGRIFLLTAQGLNWFDPREITEDTTKLSVKFTDFKLFNRSMPVQKMDSSTRFVLPGHISQLRELELRHRHSFFSIHFSANEFVAPEKIKYAYKLDGFDEDWVDVNNQNFASYTNLPFGVYTFRVKAANVDGYWGNPSIMTITVLPPFWSTWWFILLCTSLILALLFALHRYRLAQSLQVEKVRNKIASDLHDEVGSNLTRISMYSDLLKSESEKNQKEHYIENIHQTSREVVSTMSDIVWSIDSESDTLGALVQRLRDVGANLFDGQYTAVQVRINGMDERKSLSPDIRQNIFRIAKEAMNNTAKYANADRVDILFEYKKPDLKITIRDNGKGFEESKIKPGNGLKNMRKRAQSIGGHLMIESSNQGTSVTLNINL